jgi:2TM domain
MPYEADRVFDGRNHPSTRSHQHHPWRSMMSEHSKEPLDDARRYVRRKRIFYIVVGIWIALCLMWFALDMADDSSSFWFYWPMLGSGIAVAITGIVLLGIGGLFGADWERREIDKYLRRRGNGLGSSPESGDSPESRPLLP